MHSCISPQDLGFCWNDDIINCCVVWEFRVNPNTLTSFVPRHLLLPSNNTWPAQWRICWSPNWKKSLTDNGIPKLEIKFFSRKTNLGIPELIMGPQIGSVSNLGIDGRCPKLEKLPNWLWLVTDKSHFWLWDPQIGYPIWGSHYQFGDSYRVNPQTDNGIPKLDIQFGDSSHPNPQTDNGIPKLVIQFGDAIIGLGIHLTPIPKPIMASPNWITNLGIPLSVWGFISRRSPNR